MSMDDEAERAIEKFDGSNLDGRTIAVNVAKKKDLIKLLESQEDLMRTQATDTDKKILSYMIQK